MSNFTNAKQSLIYIDTHAAPFSSSRPAVELRLNNLYPDTFIRVQATQQH